MPLTNPSELKQFLNALGRRPKKGLSQNFLIDGNILKKVLKVANVSAGDSILEIGPGPGAWTEAFLCQKAHVIAVEKDEVYAEALKRFANVEVFAEDILRFSLENVPEKTKVISNLPFQLTAPILTRLAPRHDLFSTLTFLIQEEVARRITAVPNTKEYSSLTLFLNFYADVSYEFKVSKRCFFPQPKVDCAVVTLRLHPPPSNIDPSHFFPFVQKAFQQRRKMIKNTLGIAPKQHPEARPEQLTLHDFINLYLN